LAIENKIAPHFFFVVVAMFFKKIQNWQQFAKNENKM